MIRRTAGLLCLLAVAAEAPPAPARNTSASLRGKGATAGPLRRRLGAGCSTNADCPIGQYCDSVHHCNDCSYLTHVRQNCDAADGSCCNEAFLTQCPTNPKRCPLRAICEGALAKACGDARGTGSSACTVCAGAHQQPLRTARCGNDDIKDWCDNKPDGPPTIRCDSSRFSSCPRLGLAHSVTRLTSLPAGAAQQPAVPGHAHCDAIRSIVPQHLASPPEPDVGSLLLNFLRRQDGESLPQRLRRPRSHADRRAQRGWHVA